ncbi:hypothetical protein ANME2D_02928 [Candidatus Methanoperedens nitroreducens]|uniref:DUF488 domain-containing protein n=1 Tax=Candidatus Methanoperedens nitratireducens TaxID=1392998 RepID=A0A062V0L1_9EURY|nr:DUF488 domain-containing protein [Candidatus Methanoperedens nitroreducens]KCZ70902.1 hypothetical protein ANME2D_02928 [Candidatus Methanoperedens nitroreducens]MDJ1421730.1 DUF488 domain-containing protein [Candidatus Methanoperedens sp.]
MDEKKEIFTVGFAQKSAEDLIKTLKSNNITKILDIRLSPNSQQAGYAKQDTLEYILRLNDIKYEHNALLAPTKGILEHYRKEGDWEKYEKNFNLLLEHRKSNLKINLDDKENGRICLLCTEPEHSKCHRKLVAEYLAKQLKNVTIIHI